MAGGSINGFLEAVSSWAATQPDIVAVGLVGSHARGAATATSDLDLVIVVEEPARYLDAPTWVRQFGTITRIQVEDYGKVSSLRVWYTAGLEVEYGITDRSWAALPLDAGTRRVIADGLQIVFEREPLLQLAAQAPRQPGA